MKKYFITGGAGFVGSHLCEEIFFSDKNSKLVILDKLTYAGNRLFLNKIINSPRVKFIKGDILDLKIYKNYLHNIDVAINVAAESHVDNSFFSPIEFTRNNTLGAHIFLQNCINNKVKKIVQVSSDEVYGEKISGQNFENDRLQPTNPYSASKAAAEMIINSYRYSYKKEIIIIRGNNIYGPRQYPEKLISSSITNLINNRPITLHGSGNNKRHYISVVDFAKALILLISKTSSGIYNIGTKDEYRNIQIAKMICDYFNKPYKKFITYVKDRPYNDKRYSVSSKKIRDLGWKPQDTLVKKLPYIISWYKNNSTIFN